MRRSPPAAKRRPPPLPNRQALAVSLVVLVLIGGIGAAVFFFSDQRPASSPAHTHTTIRRTPSTSRSVRPVEQEPDIPATANFTYHHTMQMQNGYQRIFGTVKNTSSFTINDPEIIVVMRDKDGKELATGHGYSGHGALSAGDIAPISILLARVPAYDHLTFEPVARKASFIPPQVKGLTLESLPPEPYRLLNRALPNRYIFKGKVVHRGRLRARFIKVQVAGYDKENKVVGLGYSYAKAERLDPGQSARYEVNVQFVQQPDRFDLSLQSRLAK